MCKGKGRWLFLILSLTGATVCAEPLDLQYRPAPPGTPAPYQVRQQTQASPHIPRPPAAGERDTADGGSGWQWFAPRITASRPGAWQDSRDAVRIAQEEIDRHRLQERKSPLFNDLPPVLQSMPLTIDMGIKYHF